MIKVHVGELWERQYSEADILRFWKKGDLSYLVHPYQFPLYEAIWDIINGSDKMGVINVARQFGKTFVTTLIFMECGLRFKNWDLHFLAQNRAKLKTRVFKAHRIIMETCPFPEGDFQRPTLMGSGLQRGTDEMVFKTTASTISFFGVEEDDYRGGSPNLVNPDEAAFIKNLESLIRDEIEPALQQSKGKYILTSTPPASTDNYYISLCEKARAKGTLITFNYTQNARNSPEEIMEIRQEHTNENGELSNRFRREYMAELIADATLLVLPSWGDKKNILDFGDETEKEYNKMKADKDYPLWYKFISIDYGTKDYTVIGFYFFHFPSKRLVKEDSIWMKGENVSIGLIAERLRDRKKELWGMAYQEFPELIVCDSQDPLANQTLSQDFQVPAVGVKKDGFKSTMVSAFNDLIAIGMFVVRNVLIQDIGSYRTAVWLNEEQRGKKFARSPVYGHYDNVDGDMYLHKTAKPYYLKEPVKKEHFDINKMIGPPEVMERHLKQQPRRFVSAWDEFDTFFNNV